MALTKISRSLLDTGVSDSSDATAITIDSSENIGIGTTSPAFKLDVNGSLSSNGNENVMRIAGADANNAGGITINAVYGSTAASRVSTLFSIDGQDQASPLAFGSGTSERMRIDASGNVSIGGTSSDPLSLSFSGTGLTINEDSGVAYFQIDGGNTARIDFGQGGTRNFNIYSDASNYSELKRTTNHPILFGTNNTERMRITSAGVLAIGKTTDDTTTAGVWIRKHPTSSHGQIMATGSGSSAYEGFYVYDISNSHYEFYASYHGTVAYRALSNLSDERKKENIQDITFGLNAIKELRPVSFDWKDNKGDNQLGFIAQEVETTSLSQLIGTYRDENISDLKSINKEGIIPVLVKAIQELSAKVEELESKINE